MKQKITIALILIFIQFISNAQRPTDFAPKAAAGNMNMGRYYGKIVYANKKGIDGATLQIKGTKYDPITKKTSETILGTQLTASNGDFSFENLPVMGNLKFDVAPPRDTNKHSAALKKHLHLKHQLVLLIASSRQDEEEIILQSLLKLQYKNLVTIFVPRHPQRFKDVELLSSYWFLMKLAIPSNSIL